LFFFFWTLYSLSFDIQLLIKMYLQAFPINTNNIFSLNVMYKRKRTKILYITFNEKIFVFIGNAWRYIVIRSCISNDRLYNVQKKKDKNTIYYVQWENIRIYRKCLKIHCNQKLYIERQTIQCSKVKGQNTNDSSQYTTQKIPEWATRIPVNRWWTRVLQKDKYLLFQYSHPSCDSC
jgi:hypothetical protein